MARINIEDDLESRHEFWVLVRLCNGDYDVALGKCVRLFRECQTKYGKGESVSKEELERKGLGCMIESGWAVPYGDGFQCLGADEHFAWYLQKVSAGKKGGRPKKPEVPTRVASLNGNRTVSAGIHTVRPVNPPTLSPAPTLSQKEEEEEEEGATHAVSNEVEKPEVPTRVACLISVDVDDFLDDVNVKSQEAWVRAYGSTVLITELPLCAAAWASDTDRQERGAKGVYVRHWMQRIVKEIREKPKSSVMSTTSKSFEAEAQRTKKMINEQANLPPPTEEQKAKVRALVRQVTGGVKQL